MKDEAQLYEAWLANPCLATAEAYLAGLYNAPKGEWPLVTVPHSARVQAWLGVQVIRHMQGIDTGAKT